MVLRYHVISPSDKHSLQGNHSRNKIVSSVVKIIRVVVCRKEFEDRG
jgi:hypothetical protein